MRELDVVERGYRAVAAGDRTRLEEVFVEDVVWRLMNRAEVARTFEGRKAVVEFLLRFRELRLESMMQLGDAVVAAHSFVAPRASRVIATTHYQFRDGLVAVAECADVMQRVDHSPVGEVPDQAFVDVVERLERANEVIATLDPAVRSQAFAVLCAHISPDEIWGRPPKVWAEDSSGGDIESSAFVVMMEALAEADRALTAIVGEVKAATAAKQRLRSLVSKIAIDVAEY